jgi:hypothetical protein
VRGAEEAEEEPGSRPEAGPRLRPGYLKKAEILHWRGLWGYGPLIPRPPCWRRRCSSRRCPSGPPAGRELREPHHPPAARAALREWESLLAPVPELRPGGRDSQPRGRHAGPARPLGRADRRGEAHANRPRSRRAARAALPLLSQAYRAGRAGPRPRPRAPVGATLPSRRARASSASAPGSDAPRSRRATPRRRRRSSAPWPRHQTRTP